MRNKNLIKIVDASFKYLLLSSGFAKIRDKLSNLPVVVSRFSVLKVIGTKTMVFSRQFG